MGRRLRNGFCQVVLGLAEAMKLVLIVQICTVLNRKSTVTSCTCLCTVYSHKLTLLTSKIYEREISGSRPTRVVNADATLITRILYMCSQIQYSHLKLSARSQACIPQ